MSDGLPVDPHAPREEVKSKYTPSRTIRTAATISTRDARWPRRLGYDEVVVTALPDNAVEAFVSVGNLFSLGALRPGEQVVDLGSGGGFDCFIAVGQIGPAGRVIGIDMTEEMLGRSRAAATAMSLRNVKFR